MLYPRDVKPAKGLVKYPKITTREWKLMFEHFGIRHADEKIKDLRDVTPDELLRVVFPVTPTPSKGVWIEFDLTDYPDLHKKCKELYDTYSEISHQSCQILMQTVEVGTPVQRRLSRLDERWSQIISQAVSVKNRLFSYFDATTFDIAEILTESEQDSVLVTSAVRQWDDKVVRLRGYMNDTVDRLRAFNVAAADMSAGIDSILSAMGTMEKYVLYKFRQYRDSANQFAAHLLEGTGTTLGAPEIQGASTESPDEIDIAEYIKAMTDETKIRDNTKKAVVVRLYPASAAITHGNAQVMVHPLSHNRFLTTKIPDSNIVINLMNNIALNTLDTQWFGFYSQLFNYIVDYGNPICTVSIGLNKIKRCSLAQVPKFTDTGESVFMFPLQIISSKEGLDIGES